VSESHIRIVWSPELLWSLVGSVFSLRYVLRPKKEFSYLRYELRLKKQFGH
jgi:hypothetical protein